MTVSVVIEPQTQPDLTSQHIIIVQRASNVASHATVLRECKITCLNKPERIYDEKLDIRLSQESSEQSQVGYNRKVGTFPILLLLTFHAGYHPGYTLRPAQPSLILNDQDPVHIVWQKVVDNRQPVVIDFLGDLEFFDPESLLKGGNRTIDTCCFRIRECRNNSKFSFSRFPGDIIMKIADRLWSNAQPTNEGRLILQYALTEKACSLAVSSYFKKIGTCHVIHNRRGLVSALKYQPSMIPLLRDCHLESFGISVDDIQEQCTEFAQLLSLPLSPESLEINLSVWGSTENLLSKLSSMNSLRLHLQSSETMQSNCWEDDEDYPPISISIPRIYNVIGGWKSLRALAIEPEQLSCYVADESLLQHPDESTVVPFSAPFSLTELKIMSLPMTNSHLLSLLAPVTPLRHLTLNRIHGIDGDAIQQLLAHVADTLEKLKLVKCRLSRGERPFMIDDCLPKLPKLVVLEIDDGSAATIAGKAACDGALAGQKCSLKIWNWNGRGGGITMEDALEMTGWTSIFLQYHGREQLPPKPAWFRIARQRNIAFRTWDCSYYGR